MAALISAIAACVVALGTLIGAVWMLARAYERIEGQRRRLDTIDKQVEMLAESTRTLALVAQQVDTIDKRLEDFVERAVCMSEMGRLQDKLCRGAPPTDRESSS